MDGVLLIDKPSGPTSHDVVARMRNTTRERSVGHTGTLDPRASGLLPLVLGKATRLAQLISGGDKTYLATVRLGFTTDTDDAGGQPTSPAVRELPGDAAVEEAVALFRGTYDQRPPAYSAKKVGGKKAYDLARRDAAVPLALVSVTVHALTVIARRGAELDLQVTATAGFYVRALARDLGARLGCGGHLQSLRRTRSGWFDVADALPFEEAERLGPEAASRLISPAEALPQLPVARLTEAGLNRALHGNPVGPEHLDRQGIPPGAGAMHVRLLAADGHLVGLAVVRAGALHPVIVLG
jgi:tRNA pseudouridine55 synthase